MLSCEDVATEHKYTVQEKVEKEKCEDVPADDSSSGDKSEDTTKKERKINKETETEMKKKTEGDKSSETTTKKVCKTVTETVSKEMTNTTYNTTCSLQCKAGYAFRFKSFFLGCLSNYLDRNKTRTKSGTICNIWHHPNSMISTLISDQKQSEISLYKILPV